jgi:hypothetical protein
MTWLLTILALVLFIVAIFFWQYYKISRAYYYDKSLSNFREIQYSAIVQLSDAISNQSITKEDALEYRKFILLTKRTALGFEVLKEKIFKFSGIKGIFIKIDISSKQVEKIESNHNKALLNLKTQFARNLLTVFSTEFIFRYRLLAHFSFAVISFIIKIGLDRVFHGINKLNHIISAYKRIEKDSDDHNLFPC